MDSKISRSNAWLKKIMTLAFPSVLFLLATAWFLPSILNSQSFYGTIVGTVMDTSGSVVANATVKLTDIGTNQIKTTQTDTSGNYRFVQLLPATYRVEVAATGFKAVSRSPIPVQVDSTVRIDTQLEVGATTETVQVTTAPPLLQTDSGTLGSVVESRQIDAMPLNGRNPMNLLALDPGVVAQGSSGQAPMNGGGQTTSPKGWGNYSIGGAISGQSAEYIDGAPINTLGGNGVGLIPVQDAIQEFKIATNSVSAEFGRFGGGVIEMTTRSGGNKLKGTLYEYLRNRVLNANDFFSNHAGRKRPEWTQNQFGAMVSGPVKKDKLFFMGSWEGFRTRMGVPTTAGVPSYNMEHGIFNKKVVDPTGNCSISYYDASGSPTTASGAVAKSVIPESCFDSTAVTLMGYFPAPSSSTPNATSWFYAPVIGDNSYQLNGRGDYYLSDKQRIFARYTYWHLSDSPFRLYVGSKINSAKTKATNVSQQVVVGDTYTFGPTTILDVRAAYLREFYGSIPVSLGVDPSAFGAGWAALGSQTNFTMNPLTQFQGAYGLQISAGTTSMNDDYWNHYSLGASLMKIKGDHTFKFGGEARLLQRSGYLPSSYLGGQFSFNPAVTGDDFAGFLLGEYQSAQVVTVNKPVTINVPQGYYATDHWQVSRKLTLDLGVRWELPGGLTEKKDRNTVMLPKETDPVTGKLGAVVLVNSTLYPSRSVMPVRKNLFDPRIGFAYRIGSNLVLRGGFGVNHLPPDLIPGANSEISTVNAATTQITTTSYHGLQNPFNVLGGFKILQPAGRNANFIQAFQNQAVTVVVPTTKFPYNEQWNLAISHEFKGDAMVQIGYIGAMGIHLPSEGNINAVYSTNQLSSQYYADLQTMKNNGATQAAIIAAGQPLRPFPYFKNIYNAAPYVGTTSYNALQVTSQKRFHNGGMLMAVYAWAKTIGDTDSATGQIEAKTGGNVTGSNGFVQDHNNPRADRSILGYSTPHRVVINYLLPLPFGKGQKFGTGVSGAADKLISGWALNGVTTFQAGFPMGIYVSSGNYLSTQFGAGTIRPNVVPGCVKGTSGSPYEKYLNGNWFNTKCFTAPSDFAFGNEPRTDGSIRTQGVDNFDFSAQKSTSIGELADVQFRAEFFNLFNHTQFAPPGNALGGSYFAQVVGQANQPRLIQFSLRVNF